MLASVKVLITGGAGFIGSNLVARLIHRGQEVVVLDNLSRRGAVKNAAWLREVRGNAFRLIQADIRDYNAVMGAARRVDIIYHLAAQVAVTTSVADPLLDFEVNALGTLNVLEAARHSGCDPIVLFASTNKVYGRMEDLTVVAQPTRYAYRDLPEGVPESYPLDFHSPYGCSKGAADQYVRDYARIYGLRTVVFRQSCIYGPRQFGEEDQGWVAWLMIAAVTGRPITIYGDGKQVRDLLFIEDLLDVFERAVERIDVASGQVYNIGGGPQNTLAVWSEFSEHLAHLHGQSLSVTYDDWRPGDQRVYISDISKARRELGWEPKVGVEDGLERLYKWVWDNKDLFY